MRPDFQKLFEAAPGNFIVLAPDRGRYTILAVTDGYLRATKTQRSEIIGRSLFEVFPDNPDDPETTAQRNTNASFERALDLRIPDTQAVQKHDIRRPESEGGGFEERYWSPLNTPVLDDEGNVVCLIHRIEDVTEFMRLKQKGAEQQALAEALRSRAGEMELAIYRSTLEIQEVNQRLKTANEKLAEADRSKTAFFSNVSHELRTPLTLMLGMLEEVLAHGELPGDSEALVETAHRNSVRLLKLVNSLLDFTRVEAGRAMPSYEPTDIGRATAELVSSFASACETAGLRLLVSCPPSPPIYVDRDMWEKIVLNLVSNALKFTHHGEIEVKVEATGAGCELRVRDTGVGIPDEEQSRVFERFHRVESTQGRTLEGTGIGLSLVRELVLLHGGSVRVESAVGAGSTFIVTLPLGSAHLPADRVSVASRAPSTKLGAAPFVEEAQSWMHGEEGQPELTLVPTGATEPQSVESGAARARVLVADDNADMREYLRRLLSERFEVVTVADGRAALRAARRRRPDLVLSDVMMPRLDGFGLLRELRADPQLRTTPFLLLSARAGEEGKGEGLDAGADDYLVKPFSARELLARVSANLRLAQMREEVERAAAREKALEDNARRKNEFLAMLSHELRNPLAPIRNSLYILERCVPGGEQAKRAQQVLARQVAHLSRLVEDLLELSRITQGKMQVEKEPLELDDFVRGVVEDARAMLERNGIAFELQLHDEPLLVEADPTRLAQVVGNLLDNTAKFTPRGGHATLSLCREGEMAVLRVRDDGAGVQREVLEQLFQPFVQADATLDRSGSGLGLGLAVVKGLVDLHGGTVTAESEGAGRGTEITVRLPLCESTRAAPRKLTPVSRPRGSARRVLIVEDNKDAAETLKETLSIAGHEVEVAPDGESGVAMARAYAPDAIVCDIGLPGLDGFGVARAVRADPALASVCLVALTGYAAPEDMRVSREAGFDHHLAKPADLAALERILGDCKAGGAHALSSSA